VIRIFENALNGLGFAAIALAIFYAIIDMLAARHRLLAEHAQLSQEIPGCAEQLELRSAAVQTEDIPNRLLRMIRSNTERIQRTIVGLRLLSRDAAGDPFVNTPVAGIILNTVELCQERFRLRSVDIEKETPGPDIAIECRPSQIGQVILNLLNNSFDAVKDLPEKWIKVTVTDGEEWVEIAIEDSGWGIPKETVDRLFVPFFTTKSARHGLGLGLSISRAIIDAHHGEMALDASCSHTRFIVRLPKHQPREC